MSIDTISQTVDHVELEQIEFHPLVRARLREELQTHSQALWSAPPESIRVLQGRCEVLRWILGEEPSTSGRPTLLRDIIVKEREKAKRQREDLTNHPLVRAEGKE